MAKNAYAELAVDKLIDMGVLNEAGLEKLGQLFQGVQALGGVAVSAARRGRPPASKKGKRAARGSFNPSKDELAKMRKDGMTAKAIATKHGVSMATVNLRLRKLGLTKPRAGGKKGKK